MQSVKIGKLELLNQLDFGYLHWIFLQRNVLLQWFYLMKFEYRNLVQVGKMLYLTEVAIHKLLNQV